MEIDNDKIDEAVLALLQCERSPGHNIRRILFPRKQF